MLLIGEKWIWFSELLLCACSSSILRCPDPKYEKASLENIHTDLQQWSNVRQYILFLSVCLIAVIYVIYISKHYCPSHGNIENCVIQLMVNFPSLNWSLPLFSSSADIGPPLWMLPRWETALLPAEAGWAWLCPEKMAEYEPSDIQKASFSWWWTPWRSESLRSAGEGPVWAPWTAGHASQRREWWGTVFFSRNF